MRKEAEAAGVEYEGYDYREDEEGFVKP